MIEIHDLNKRFKKKTALYGVNLKLDTGVCGLLGPNGSGKTTLLRCITGVLSPNGGSVSCEGRIGYLPQRFGMQKQLTVYDAMAFFAAMKEIDRNRRRAEIRSCLERVNLLDRAHDRVGALSGGMVRRLGIAQALLGEPSILLFDEPTAELDPEERMRFKNLVSQLRRDIITVISTHIVDDVEAVCDQIVILHQGRVIVQSSVESIRQNAAGKVYEVRNEEIGALRQPWELLREEVSENGRCLRILSEDPQPGKLVSPTVEDGYMRYIRGEA